MNDQRWVSRPDGANWGDFGADDELGRLNLITPACVIRAAREIRAGLSFCLSLPLDYPGGNALSAHRHPPRLQPTRGDDGVARYNMPVARHLCCTDVVSDDAVLLHTQYSTQWDSLAHVGGLFDADGDGVAEAVYYNGYRAEVDVIGPDQPGAAFGAHRLGIGKMAAKAVQSRGILVDLYRIAGRERRYIGYDDFMPALDAARTDIEAGDIICLYTGLGDVIMELGGNPAGTDLHASCAVLDGGDIRLQRWIADSGIAALVADNYAVEGLPALAGEGRPNVRLPLHELCLFKLGLPLGELWYFGELAAWLRAHDRAAFMLTAPPLRLTRAVGSPVTPVATV
jgi:hypothetical protein